MTRGWPTVPRPYVRKLVESLTICRPNCKGRTSTSIIFKTLSVSSVVQTRDLPHDSPMLNWVNRSTVEAVSIICVGDVVEVVCVVVVIVDGRRCGCRFQVIHGRMPYCSCYIFFVFVTMETWSIVGRSSFLFRDVFTAVDVVLFACDLPVGIYSSLGDPANKIHNVKIIYNYSHAHSDWWPHLK